MKRVQIVVALLLGGLVFSSAQPVQAQSRPYVNRSFAPHLDALRRYPGPLQGFNYNYYSPGRPGANLDRALATQERVMASQAATIRDLQGQANRIAQQMVIRPTGSAATFMNRSQYMNLSHYYSGVRRGGGGAAAGGRRGSSSSTTYRGTAGSFGSF